MGTIAQNIERNARRLHGMHEYKDPSSLTYESHSILLSVIQCYPIIQSPLGFIALNTNILNGPGHTPHEIRWVFGEPQDLMGWLEKNPHVIMLSLIYPYKSRCVSFV